MHKKNSPAVAERGSPDKASSFRDASPRPIAAVNQGFALIEPRKMTPRPKDAASKCSTSQGNRTNRACDGNQIEGKTTCGRTFRGFRGTTRGSPNFPGRKFVKQQRTWSYGQAIAALAKTGFRENLMTKSTTKLPSPPLSTHQRCARAAAPNSARSDQTRRACSPRCRSYMWAVGWSAEA